MMLTTCATIALLFLPNPQHERIVKNHLHGEWQLSRHVPLGDYSKEDIEALDSIFKMFPSKFVFSNQGSGFINAPKEGIDNGNEPAEIVKSKTINFTYWTHVLSVSPVLLVNAIIREENESYMLNFVYFRSTVWCINFRFDYLLDRILGKESGNPLVIVECKKLPADRKTNGS